MIIGVGSIAKTGTYIIDVGFSVKTDTFNKLKVPVFEEPTPIIN